MLSELITNDLAVMLRLAQCRSDTLEQEIGPVHHEAIYGFEDLIECFDSSDAVTRSRALLTACGADTKKGRGCIRHCMRMLCIALRRDGQYKEAEMVAWEIIGSLDSIVGDPHEAIDKLRALELLTLALQGGGDDLTAESYMRCLVLESVDLYGPGALTRCVL